MKYIRLILLIALASCGGTIDETKLVGEWRVEEFSANTPDLSPALIEAAKEDAISTTYILNSDGTYTVASNYDPNGIEGAWKFYSTGDLLELTEIGVSTQMFSVESLDSVTMVWVQDVADFGNLTFTLKRVN
ncbi:hypothetical protein [Ekhidna sp. To15]|uniref:hypothetical protein n=1 Tax=Ekhidna sp. To15 TaxID=3395267 RepID=UPI003F51BA69